MQQGATVDARMRAAVKHLVEKGKLVRRRPCKDLERVHDSKIIMMANQLDKPVPSLPMWMKYEAPTAQLPPEL